MTLIFRMPLSSYQRNILLVTTHGWVVICEAEGVDTDIIAASALFR